MAPTMLGPSTSIPHGHSYHTRRKGAWKQALCGSKVSCGSSIASVFIYFLPTTQSSMVTTSQSNALVVRWPTGGPGHNFKIYTYVRSPLRSFTRVRYTVTTSVHLLSSIRFPKRSLKLDLACKDFGRIVNCLHRRASIDPDTGEIFLTPIADRKRNRIQQTSKTSKIHSSILAEKSIPSVIKSQTS